MFRQIVSRTALTTDIANNYFENIHGESFNGDVTFLSTLRALIAPRMSKDERLNLYFCSENRFDAQTMQSNSCRQLISSMCSRFAINDEIGAVYIFNINGAQEANKACLDMIRSNFAKVYDGWHRLTRVTDLFRTQFYTLCFVNPELKSVAVFVDSLSTSKMHYLQCAILGFFPWYFSPENGISEEEMSLINTLRGKDSNAYIECIRSIAEKYDFRTERIKQQLAGFETRYERIECDRVKNEIYSADSTISRLNREINEFLRRRRDYEIRLLGLETKIASNDGSSEIMDYFICNKKLDLECVDDRFMTFVVKDYISYFDEDAAKRIIDNRGSYVYYDVGENNISEEKIRELMYAVFIDQIIKIKVCAAYTFDLSGSVNGISGYNFTSECSGYMPNPHIQNHSCMGSYNTLVNEALQNNDYISALEQTIASAKSLNFGDSVVMREFMRNVYGLNGALRNKKYLELPDGTSVTALEAIDWVWNQNHNEE